MQFSFRSLLGHFQLVKLIEERTRKIRRKYYPYAALNKLDKKIEKYLPSRGYFVEAGSNDGFKQSNTYFLEKKYGWTGTLIEPVERLYKECKVNRPNSLVVNAALVAPSSEGKIIELIDVDLMSVIKNSNQALNSESKLARAELIQNITRKECSAIGKTLTTILIESSAPKDFELLSLDVEGFELEVLKGLDLEKFKPRYILIETSNLLEVLIVLNNSYSLLEQLTAHDYFLVSN
jgi:FkbM family methyltransferase